MKRNICLKRRREQKLPPEKLYAILRRMYPKNMADKEYTELTGLEPPNVEHREE